MFNWKKVNKTIKNGVKRIVGGYLANSIKKNKRNKKNPTRKSHISGKSHMSSMLPAILNR